MGGVGGGGENKERVKLKVSVPLYFVLFQEENDAVSVVGPLGHSRFELKQGLFRSQSL